MPGAGKDTQADLLESKCDYTIIRVGKLVREIAEHNPLIDSEQHDGELAEPEVVDNIVLNAIVDTEPSAKIVCDGYPRSIAQAKKLDDICRNNHVVIKKAIYIEIPEEEVARRLLLRGREDDSKQAIQKRLEIFHHSTKPVLDYYKENNILSNIDGVGDILDINQRILKVIQ